MNREPLHSPSTQKKPATKRTWQLRKSWEKLPDPEEEPPVNRKLFHDHGDDDDEQEETAESEPGGMEQDPEANEIESEHIPLTQPDDHDHDQENDDMENTEDSESMKDDVEASQDHEETDIGISKGTFKDPIYRSILFYSIFFMMITMIHSHLFFPGFQAVSSWRSPAQSCSWSY